MRWQVKLFDLSEKDPRAGGVLDLGEWEPFGVTGPQQGYRILAKREIFSEADEEHSSARTGPTATDLAARVQGEQAP